MLHDMHGMQNCDKQHVFETMRGMPEVELIVSMS